MNSWVISDTHLGHANIVRGISKWKDKPEACRNFETLKEHDDTIIDCINKYVKKEDTLFHLGDFSMGGKENIKKYRQRINCNNIHLCLGNHDKHLRKNSQLEDGTRVCDLFTSVQETILIVDKKLCGLNFFMGHWAQRAWYKGSSGCVNLHGDAHGTLEKYQKLLQIADDPYLFKTGDYYKQQDCGVDVAFSIFGEYRPFSINDDIKPMMENRINLNVDHH